MILKGYMTTVMIIREIQKQVKKVTKCRFLFRSAQVSVLFGAALALPVSAVESVKNSYLTNSHAKSFMAKMEKEHGFSSKELQGWFSAAQKKQSILDAISRPAEKTKTWGEYRKIFLTDRRVKRGVEFWKENKETLARAEKTFGVPAEMIVAIIGVETRYGRITGSYRVIDALSTLAFDYPKRSPFFTKELREFLLLTREQKMDPLGLKGSYAGAMGYGQFMPSSFRNYAVDFDGDGIVDIWNNPVDAIGSVANYFKRHGWQPNELVTSLATATDKPKAELLNDSLKPKHSLHKLIEHGYTPIERIPGDGPANIMKLRGDQGDEYWMGYKNFYVITRYNHSRLYAMAAYQLSLAIKSAWQAS